MPARRPGPRSQPQRLVIGGYEHEWPPAFESFVARELVGRDAVDLVRLGDLADAPLVLAAGFVSALVVQAERLGLKELLLLQECRRVSPRTALVAVATTGRFGMKSALEGGATAFLSWPASAEAVRQALRSGEVAGGNMSEAVPHTTQDLAGERPVGSSSPAGAGSGGEVAPAKHEQVETVLALAALDAQLHEDEPQPRVRARAVPRPREAEVPKVPASPRRRRPDLEAQRTAARKRLPADVVVLYDRALRSGREPLVVKLVSGICSGCNLQLATSIAQRVRRSRSLAACPHCGRLLYEVTDAGAGARTGK